jgi:hypothetical protein
VTSNERWAYLAGIIDGEGSVMFTRPGKGKNRAPQVTVASSDRELVDYLVEQHGGSVSSKPARQPTHRDSWAWRVTNQRALRILEGVLPYLRIDKKRNRAKLLVSEYPGTVNRGGHYPEGTTKHDDLSARFHAL